MKWSAVVVVGKSAGNVTCIKSEMEPFGAKIIEANHRRNQWIQSGFHFLWKHVVGAWVAQTRTARFGNADAAFKAYIGVE